MEFQYPFITTGIGSFPHQDEKEVFGLIFKDFPEIPFWPQLPKRSFLEGMVVQYSEGFPSLRWNEKEQRVWIENVLRDLRKKSRNFTSVSRRTILSLFKSRRILQRDSGS